MKKLLVLLIANCQLLIVNHADAQSLSVSANVINNVRCHGGSNGKVSATAAGGTTPYTYAWSPGGINTRIDSNLIAGNYTVIVHDHLGTSTSASVTITQPAPFSVVIVSAPGGHFGTGPYDTLTASGAVSYLWNTGSTNTNILAFAPYDTAIYSVIGTNAMGCTASASISVYSPAVGAPFQQLQPFLSLQNLCGLNYITASQLVETRSQALGINTNGTGLPTSVTVSGLPSSCYKIVNAYLYATTSYTTTIPGDASTVRVTITNPASFAATASVDLIGVSNDKDWGETGTAGYRADISGMISGNGTYHINITDTRGSCNSWELDGVSLFIIYQDLSANYSANINIDDGLMTASYFPQFGPYYLQYGTTSFDVSCLSGISDAVGFDIISDDQSGANGSIHTDNILATPANFSNNFWDFDQISIPLSATNTVVPFDIYTNNNPGVGGGDDYSVCMVGMYWHSTCTSCSPLSATISPNPVSVCSGNSVTLTANGSRTESYTYLWSNGGTTSSITITPGSSTTYSVIVTDTYGCSASATVPVTVNTPPSVSISASSNVCISTPVTSTITGGASPYTYSWNPSGQTTANITALSTGTYTLTVTDNNGCSASATTTFTVDPDCCYLPSSCSNPLTIPSGSSSGSYTSSQFSSNPCISISGTGTFLIPSGTFTITNCDIAMGDNATIEVASGATLIIDNSRLYACGDMWQGIKVDLGGTLYISGTSPTSPCIIEDAIYGVYLEGSATISYGLLNNNLYDIYANGLGGSTPALRLVSSMLSCQVDAGYSNNAYLKTPHLGAITNSGVYITNFSIPNGITVGDNSSPYYYNTFNNMNYGVNANNAAFLVQNNVFENLLGSGPCIVVFNTYTYCPPPIGIAVLANNSTPGIEYVGGNWDYYAAVVTNNVMEQCWRGVDITSYSYPIITINNLYNTTNVGLLGSRYGDHGIYLKTVGMPEITENTISNFSTGIHINDFGFTAPNALSHIGDINDNQISTTGGTTGVLTTGILAENALSVPSYYLNAGETNFPMAINDNTVTDAGSSCITLSYSIPVYYGLMGIGTNTVTILPSTSQSNRTQRSGIYLAADQNFSVEDNSISATGTYTLNPTTSPKPADTSVIGIRAVISKDGIYECNDMNHVGECMMYEGLNYPSKLYYNSMEYAYNGLVLESSGEVGTLGASNDPIGNKWNGPFSNDYTYTLNSYASSSIMYTLRTNIQDPTYSGNNATYNPNTGDFYSYGTNVFTATGSVPSSCPATCTKCSFSVEKPQYRGFAQRIVDDSIPYSVFIDESKYMGQQAVYNQISNDTTLMDSSTILHNFYHYTSCVGDTTNNIGRLYTINMDIAGGNYSAASMLNSSITPINLIEQNQQLVNYVYLSTVAVGVDTATVADYDTLVGVAVQCPVEGGNAVLEARGLLNLLFNTSVIVTDSCLNDSSSGHAAHRRPLTVNSIVSNINAKVYPNPANTMLNIQVNLQAGQIAYFTMYNSLGEEIENMELNGALTILPTNNLAAGMYYYRITDKNGNTIKADKQMLMH